jgi:glycosyltransferase involved in cell wall biosynthesis
MAITLSVIIPTHNRANLLKKAIESVRAQTFQEMEIIIINDASTDETEQLLHDLIKIDARIKVISNPTSLGGSKSRNKGIFASQGEWIAFLDDDDIWLPEKIEQQLKALHSNPRAVAASCAFIANYPFNIKKHITTPSNISVDNLLISNSLGGASVCICSAALVKQIDGFDGHLKSAQDWDLWLRLRLMGEIISVNKALVQYQVHFNYRISNDMRAKYLGSRRFYLKYKHLMKNHVKQRNLCFIFYIKSRQKHRSFQSRMKNLLSSVMRSPMRIGFSYFLSSFPRLFIDSVKR